MVVLTRITNPIEWQETRHQERHIPQVMRRYWLLVPLVLALAVAQVAVTLLDVTRPTRELGILTIWMVHATVGARAIAAGANAISREHVGQTWDILVLTGVSARSILWGKWRGVLHRLAPWMLALGGVRLAMLPIFMLAFLNRYAYYRSGYYSGGYAYYASSSAVGWVAWASFLAVVMTVALTVLEVMTCAAIGLAASATLRKGWLAMVAAFCVRLAPVIAFGVFTRYEIGVGPSWRVLRFPPLALADGGSAPLYQLMLPTSTWTMTAHVDALPGLALATVLLAAFLVAALLVCWRAIRRSGALPHPKVALAQR